MNLFTHRERLALFRSQLSEAQTEEQRDQISQTSGGGRD